MAWLRVVGLVLGSLGFVAWLHRRQTRTDVSAAWLIDQQRRTWAQGIDGVSWTWPLIWRGVCWRRRS